MHDDSSPVRLHSRYDPQKEARRFADSHSFQFNPAYIVVSEPGESHLAPVFRSRFPDVKLVALRYIHDLFLESDDLWDAVWRPDTGQDVSSFLVGLIPDEYIPLTVYLAWKPSDIRWPEISAEVWRGISSSIRIQSSVMHTRTHFGRRWLSNMFRNTLLITSGIQPQNTNKPYFLAAAGPSLERHVPVDNRVYAIIAVSSALSCLRNRNTHPDICIATDGGYWALSHFKGLPSVIPVAFPLEAAIPSWVLETNPSVVLSYGSPLESRFLEILGITGVKAKRNGTVSGTAALYALDHTSSSVYAAGLDLQASTSFSHARPHVSDIDTDLAVDRFHPLATYQFSRNLDCGSLDIYASWFESREDSFKKRFFTLSPAGREIRGIRCVSCMNKPLHVFTDSVPAEELSLTGKDSRKKKMLFWIDGMISKLQQTIDDSKLETIHNEIQDNIFVDPLFTELFQMVSYMEYVQYLKKTRSIPPTDDAQAASVSLLNTTLKFLEKMRAVVQTYE
jgi:hypothetical protein